MTIKIYVASLEAYNNGRMVGAWITPTDYLSFEKFWNAVQVATEYADEVAVHDYEGINLSNEYPDVEELYYFCHALEDSWVDEEVILAYAEYTGEDLNNELIANAENNYVGTFSSFQEYADEWADEQLRDTDNVLKNYFDYERYARDLEYDFMVCDVSDYNVAVFSNC
jgi:antirestriction protein|tara:strand:- start:465 stop:968 length:504 start_codon:yes stop_codon:yes gene_type:complete